MKRSYRYCLSCLNIPLLAIFLFFLPNLKTRAEEKSTFISQNDFSIAIANKKNDSQQVVSISAKDLLAQENTTITRVTGIEVKQTPQGLELILKTVAGSQRLVPLILPENNDLVIDLLDATLAFAIRNGVEEVNPTEGINKITVNKIDESSIRVRISGVNQAPSAEVVPGSNLVLSVTPEGATTGPPFEGLSSASGDKQAPDEEIEIIATGEGETDNYYVPEASSATRTDTPIRNIPQSIQVIPQEIIEDQQVIRLDEAINNVSGTTYFWRYIWQYFPKLQYSRI
jgi:iron complex outermembrane recepter protein